MELTWTNVGLVVSGAVLAWLGLQVQTLLKRNVHIATPAERSLDHIVPMVNMLAHVQGPMLVCIEALLEASKGKCNGNIDNALEVMKDARECYDSYVQNRLEVPAK